MWTCAKCGNKVDQTFDVCWSCGTSQEGVEDPTFVPADLVGPIEEPPVLAGLEPARAEAPELVQLQPLEMRECYPAETLAEAHFIADQLLGQGIPAVAHDFNFFDREKYPANIQAHVVVSAHDVERAQAWIEEHNLRERAMEMHGAEGNDLVECYQALNHLEARFLADQLAEQGILAKADTEDMRAELGSMNSAPRVWVRARDYSRARELVEEHERQHKAQHPSG